MSGDELGELLAEAEAKLEKVRGYVTTIRMRADLAGPQAYAFTYRFVADELENLIR